MAAGTAHGASIAPFSPVHFATVLATRSRRLHGAFCIEATLARVWSSRRAGDERGVLLALGTDTPTELNGRYTATQARMIARALTDAADAVEQLEPVPTARSTAPTLVPHVRSTAPRAHFGDRPFGFDPRWQVQHRVACGERPTRLVAPRYIGGSVAVNEQPGVGREGGAA